MGALPNNGFFLCPPLALAQEAPTGVLKSGSVAFLYQ
jgi:hypothetical protein